MTIRSHREAEAVIAEFVTVGDIAARIQVEGNVVSNWAARHESFPAPVRVMGKAQVWWWPEIELWLRLREKSVMQPTAKCPVLLALGCRRGLWCARGGMDLLGPLRRRRYVHWRQRGC